MRCHRPASVELDSLALSFMPSLWPSIAKGLPVYLPRARVERRDQRLGDDPQRPPGDLTRLAQARERRLLGQALALHQQPLRTLDRLAGGERLRERVGLLAERDELLVTGSRGLDRREQVGLAERLHEVAED